MKTLEEIKKLLAQHKHELHEQYHVQTIGIFGSYVKDKQKKKSDLDILVSFEPGYKTFDNYMDLMFYLEDLLGLKIDLVIRDALKEELKDYILAEAIYV